MRSLMQTNVGYVVGGSLKKFMLLEFLEIKKTKK
jgi:hypothetical protein